MLKKNKYILVTGTSSGIGKQTALDLLKKFFVVGISRNKASIKNPKYLHLSIDLSERNNDEKVFENFEG